MNPKISIIVPCYNGEKTLKACINSIENTNYENLEIIIINDGSKDDTESVALKLKENDERIKYFYQENAGVSFARNSGISKATRRLYWFC